MGSTQIQMEPMASDWPADAVFITAGNAQISAEGMLRNFDREASHVCAEMAAKWAARDDAHAENVWRTVQQLVDRSIAAGDLRRGGNYGHIPRHPHPELEKQNG